MLCYEDRTRMYEYEKALLRQCNAISQDIPELKVIARKIHANLKSRGIYDFDLKNVCMSNKYTYVRYGTSLDSNESGTVQAYTVSTGSNVSR